MRNLLIDPSRVTIGDYFKTWRQEFRLAGFICVTPYTAPPPWKTWDNAPYNRFTAIATEALVDGRPAFVIPVFVNDAQTKVLFGGEMSDEENKLKPAIAFFKGNDDAHYALRFATFSERDQMLEFFGEDVAMLDGLLFEN